MVSFYTPIVLLDGRAADGNQQFTRDQSVMVDVTFYDDTGAVVTPSSASLTLDYITSPDGCRTHVTYALTQSSDVWSYTWDSSAAQRGVVYGHAATSAPVYAVDFRFRLTANLSNRELAGDDVSNGYCR
jgi:hypothetical protein